MRKNSNSIGIFDSGLGGLTVVKQIINLLPHENIIYFGDTARVPYGPRSTEVIKKFSEEDTEFLLNYKVKCIVIACNTSSAVAADHLKRKYKKVPIFEVIDPAAKKAAEGGKRTGVIGTRATIASHAYEKKIKKYSKSVKVFVKSCPLFVPFIEEGEITGSAIRLVSKKYLFDFKIKKIDTLILGCTHYPMIKDVISEEFDKNINMIDPGVYVAAEVKEFLKSNNLLNFQKHKGSHRYFVSDLTARFVEVAEMFLGSKISGRIQKVNI